MLNKMGGKKKFVAVKASTGKKRKTGFVRKQQRQIAQMNQLKNGSASEDPVDQPEANGPSVEVKFAQRLAANDPKIREKAISKLRKWIQGSYRSLTEMDMLKLWKGLHYCFWMSDKPLLQEELAENISNIIHCFDTEKALLFFKCFLTTLGREWIGIDRWRTDKFMMFARRVLRQTLLYVMKKVNEDDEEILDQFVTACDSGVISAQDSRCAVGFKLHFTDIFMEELTKVNATFDEDLLTDDLVETLVEPFLRQIVQGEETRVTDQIEERIFNHLIRQSDVALAYEEGSDDEGDMEGQMDEEEGEEEEEEEEEEAVGKFDLATSDPRAGVGDVCLPQLDLDYNRMAEVLLKAGGEPSVGHHQRKRLYAMSKRFQLLANGIFPFAAELNDDGEVVDREEGIEDINVGKEIARERKEADKRSEEAKKERERFKQALKDKKAGREPAAKPKKQEKKQEKKMKGNKEKSRERIEKFMEKQAQKKAKDELASSPVKKVKKAKKGEAEEIATTKATDNQEDVVEHKIKKKKKKKAETIEEVTETQSTDSVEKEQSEEEQKSSKKKSKKRKSMGGDQPVETQPKKTKSVVEEEETETSAFAVASSSKKKKQSKKQEAAPAFEVDDGWGEPIQDGEIEMVEENPNYNGKVKLAPAAEPAKKSKKKSEDSPKKFKTKSEDSPKKSKKKSEDNSNPDLPKISTPESMPKTQFFRKAVSKSAQKEGKKAKDLTMSEPAKKAKKSSLAAEKGRKLNLAMSQNKVQTLLDMDRSMQESPEIPFDAERMPTKGLLKVKTPTSTPVRGGASKKMSKTQSVMYNTMMNSKSPFAAKRRPVAADFF